MAEMDDPGLETTNLDDAVTKKQEPAQPVERSGDGAAVKKMRGNKVAPADCNSSTEQHTKGWQKPRRKSSTVTKLMLLKRATKEGSTVRPFDQALADKGIFQRNLPSTVYTVMILIFLSSRDERSAWSNVVRHTFVPACLSCTAQFVYAYYIRNTVVMGAGDLQPHCSNCSFVLQCVALYAFLGLSVEQFLSRLEMHLWIQMFPKSKKFETLELQKYFDESSPGSSPALVNGKKYVMHRPVSGIPRHALAMLYILVFPMMLAPSILVTWGGSGALLRSNDNHGLIFNSVAAIFILELDSYTYRLLIWPTLRSAVEAMPPLNRGAGEGQCAPTRKFIVTHYALLISLFILALCVPIYVLWCPDESWAFTF